METVEEGSIDQTRWPNHGSYHKSVHGSGDGSGYLTWPDQYFTEDTSQTVPNHLSGDTHQEVEAPAKVLTVEASLSRQSIRSVRHASGNIDIGHHDDQGMFLHIEFARIQTERPSKETELPRGHRIVPAYSKRVRHELYGKRSNGDGRLSQGEQSIQARSN